MAHLRVEDLWLDYNLGMTCIGWKFTYLLFVYVLFSHVTISMNCHLSSWDMFSGHYVVSLSARGVLSFLSSLFLIEFVLINYISIGKHLEYLQLSFCFSVYLFSPFIHVLWYLIFRFIFFNIKWNLKKILLR